MQTPTLDMMALYHWDEHLFDNFVVPPQLNRDYIIQMILINTEGMEVMYPEPFVLRNILGVWSSIRMPVWQHLYETTQYEYNPIHNYDRSEGELNTHTSKRKVDAGDTEGINIQRGTESERDTTGNSTGNTAVSGTQSGTSDNTRTTNESGNGSETRTPNLTQSTTGTDNTTESVAAFNSSTFQPHTKTELDTSRTVKQTGVEDRVSEYESNGTITDKGTTSGKNNETTDTTGSTTGKDTYTEGQKEQHDRNLTQERNEQFGSEDTRKLYAYGNIGTTTTQKMISEEREIAMFNLSELIVEETKNRFCVLVY